MISNCSHGTASQMLKASRSSVRIPLPGLEEIYMKGSNKSDSFACDHRESNVDEGKLSTGNCEDDIGDIDTKKKTHTDAVLCSS
jgi:hypothetical protein